ncbi:hypothetical protein D6C86_06842 [Aureobasidium pullulans]|uniref:Rhodopsin domain-containing protein n=1 Tax=Aureobasidium pullulans TaxID=5580 RepID=A0A4S9P3T3_AURPU|nr:hypothetical protein D6D23_04909 [Aureobasidium pullulans]THX43688.1 hypothetical protein D6D10_00982 [Aureobasidium pullulans]THY07133.1 hypothetical protein D6D02_07300 [Aureobasidium pullulans]THY63125.1 hypothetical protein D6C97_03034 [Aureobasidium pullulans]THZ57788.1 hypothetical protein D6C86_06842 [Aureobasidium pullulans]
MLTLLLPLQRSPLPSSRSLIVCLCNTTATPSPSASLVFDCLHLGSRQHSSTPGSPSVFVIMGSDAFAIENRKDLVVVVNVILSFSTLSALALRFAKVTGNAKQRKFDAQNIMICLAGLYISIFCFYLACNMFVKFALLFFYRHTTYERWHHWVIWFMEFVAFGFGVSSILVIIFQCVPIAHLWDKNTPGTCVDIKAFFYSNSIIMIVNDIILYVLPIIFTWKLQLRLTQRIVLNLLFALGAFVVAASFIRLYVVYRYDQDGDLSWNIASCLIWSSVENHLAVFIACSPSIKAVVSGVLYPLVSSQVSSFKDKIKRSRGSEGGSLPTHKSPSLTLATIGSRPSRFVQKVRDPFATSTRRDSFNTLDSGFEYVNRGHHEMDPIERANSEATLSSATYRKDSEASTSSKEPQVQVYAIDDAISPTSSRFPHPTLDSSKPQSHQ